MYHGKIFRNLEANKDYILSIDYNKQVFKII